MPTGICRLCQVHSELQLSHILPAFAFRWLRDSSGNGYIRNTLKPDKRVQDGVKQHWLCSSCEERFSRSETAFAGKLFHPYLATSEKVFHYSNWLLHFCTSVSWRVLRFYADEGHLNAWEPQALEHVTKAESIWREFLLGQRTNPGLFQQHFLPLDQIGSATGYLAPNINRYLMRAIHMDICRSSKSIYTYSKLGRFIIVGFVYEPNLSHWKGTKVNVTNGYIEPRKFIIPSAFGDYLNEKAKNMYDAFASISGQQYAKVDQAFRKNIDRFVGSDSFTAMQADVDMFGDEAFTKRDK